MRHLDAADVTVVAVVDLLGQVHDAEADPAGTVVMDRAPQQQPALAIEAQLLGDIRIRLAGDDDDLPAVDRFVGLVDQQRRIALPSAQRQREVGEAQALLHLEAGQVARRIGVPAAAAATATAAANRPCRRAVGRADRRVGCVAMSMRYCAGRLFLYRDVRRYQVARRERAGHHAGLRVLQRLLRRRAPGRTWR